MYIKQPRYNTRYILEIIGYLNIYFKNLTHYKEPPI